MRFFKATSAILSFSWMSMARLPLESASALIDAKTKELDDWPVEAGIE
jgi:hypothetical protein